MANRLVFRFLLISFFLVNISCFEPDVEPIIWGSKEISWSDFKEGWRLNESPGATIYTGVYCPSIITSENSNVYALMYPGMSVRNKMKYLNDELLEHEIYHFNIAEYHARLVRRSIVNVGEDELTRARLYSIQEFYNDERAKFQSLYDSITEHGLDKGNQISWQNKIDSLLLSTMNYSKTNIYDYPEYSF